jgi:NAD-dependent deacetylase
MLTIHESLDGFRYSRCYMNHSKPKLVFLTGAGISAESGIQTFRGTDGLWENHRVEDVATPEAWNNDPELVLRFYNERRRIVLDARPNLAHQTIVQLESDFDVQVVTQNVDDLHERAGSSRVLHLHGEILKSRSSKDATLVYPVQGWEIKLGDLCERGYQLRPHIVWFGESVPAMGKAIEIVAKADIVAVVGTSLRVYPAAGLIDYAPKHSRKFLIDPAPISADLEARLERYFPMTACEGLPEFASHIA